MKKNMGKTDRTIRLMIAVVLIGLFFAGMLPGTIGIIALVFAGVFILTSSINFCPLYPILKIDTREGKAKR